MMRIDLSWLPDWLPDWPPDWLPDWLPEWLSEWQTLIVAIIVAGAGAAVSIWVARRGRANDGLQPRLRARFLLLLGLAAAFWYWQRTRTPEYALAQIHKSVEQHDLAKFRKYVDVEGASSRFVDDALSFVEEDLESQPYDSWDALGEQLGQGMIRSMKPTIVDATKEQIERYAGTGAYIDYGAEHAGESVYGVAQLSRQTGIEPESLAGVAYVRKQGGTALIGVDVVDERHDTTLVLELGLRDIGSHWQLAEVANLKGFLHTLDQLEQRRVRRLNEPIKKRTAKILAIRDGVVRKGTREFGIGRFVQFGFHITNIGQKDISTFDGAIIASTTGVGQEIKSFVVSGPPLLARDRNIFGWKVDLNMFDSADKQLYATPVAQLVVELSVRRVEFADGSVLRHYDKWEPLRAGP